ncbi:hypothetical protein SFUMM280S_10634 [Streptomyces fumanus]
MSPGPGAARAGGRLPAGERLSPGPDVRARTGAVSDGNRPVAPADRQRAPRRILDRPFHIRWVPSASGRAAHGARGAGDEDRVALLEGGGAQQADVGGQAGHAEHAEVRGQGRGLGVDLDGVPGVDGGVLAPAEEVQHVVTDGDALGVRLHDLADRAALHGLAQLEGGDVGLGGAHPAAHVRVDGEVAVAHQHLALGERGDLLLDQGEVLGLRPADRTAQQVPCAVDGGAGGGLGHGAPLLGQGVGGLLHYLKQRCS